MSEKRILTHNCSVHTDFPMVRGPKLEVIEQDGSDFPIAEVTDCDIFHSVQSLWTLGRPLFLGPSFLFLIILWQLCAVQSSVSRPVGRYPLVFTGCFPHHWRCQLPFRTAWSSGWSLVDLMTDFISTWLEEVFFFFQHILEHEIEGGRMHINISFRFFKII